MPLTDLPLAILFLLFLWLFLLIGLVPAWQRSARKIRKYLDKTFGRPEEPTASSQATDSTPFYAESRITSELNDFEYIILRQLAQTGSRGLSRKQIDNTLHLEPMVVKRALKSLQIRGLVRYLRRSLFGKRLYLSERGRDFSIEQGFIPRIHEQPGKL